MKINFEESSTIRGIIRLIVFVIGIIMLFMGYSESTVATLVSMSLALFNGLNGTFTQDKREQNDNDCE